MPENWVPSNMLVFALWGPFSDAPEVEFSMQASTGPRERRSRDEVQGGDGTEGSGCGGGDDKGAAVTCPDIMKKLGETGGMLSRREIAKRKKEDKQELKKRRKAADERADQVVSSMGVLATSGSSIDRRLQHLVSIREAESRVAALKQTLAIYTIMGDPDMIRKTQLQLIEALRPLTERSAEQSSTGLPATPGAAEKSTEDVRRTGAGGDVVGSSTPGSGAGSGGENIPGATVAGGGGGPGSNNSRVTGGVTGHGGGGDAGSIDSPCSASGNTGSIGTSSSAGAGSRHVGGADGDVLGGGEDDSETDTAGDSSGSENCNGAGTSWVRQGVVAGHDEVVRLDTGDDDDATTERGNWFPSSSARIRSVGEDIDVADDDFDWRST